MSIICRKATITGHWVPVPMIILCCELLIFWSTISQMHVFICNKSVVISAFTQYDIICPQTIDHLKSSALRDNNCPLRVTLEPNDDAEIVVTNVV